MNKLLFADSAGPSFQKIYGTSHFALAALVPASLVSPPEGAIAKVADVGLAAALTVHNHIALNYGARSEAGAVVVGRHRSFAAGHHWPHAVNNAVKLATPCCCCSD